MKKLIDFDITSVDLCQKFANKRFNGNFTKSVNHLCSNTYSSVYIIVPDQCADCGYGQPEKCFLSEVDAIEWAATIHGDGWREYCSIVELPCQ